MNLQKSEFFYKPTLFKNWHGRKPRIFSICIQFVFLTIECALDDSATAPNQTLAILFLRWKVRIIIPAAPPKEIKILRFFVSQEWRGFFPTKWNFCPITFSSDLKTQRHSHSQEINLASLPCWNNCVVAPLRAFISSLLPLSSSWTGFQW